MSQFKAIADELKARGASVEAQELKAITEKPQVSIPAKIVEAVRILEVIQGEAARDPALVHLAARTSLLSHQIQGVYLGSRSRP